MSELAIVDQVREKYAAVADALSPAKTRASRQLPRRSATARKAGLEPIETKLRLSCGNTSSRIDGSGPHGLLARHHVNEVADSVQSEAVKARPRPA